jgi:putative ABC transport system substrate-binding protein
VEQRRRLPFFGPFLHAASRPTVCDVLMALTQNNPEVQRRLAAFRGELEKLGWSEERNLHIDYRFAPGGTTQERALAKELVALGPDVMLGHSTPVAVALRQESSTIPIVFTNVSDPIGAGLIASLARPGGNVTGLTILEPAMSGKWLQMLKEIAPRLTRAAVVFNPKTTSFAHYLDAAKAAAARLGIEIVIARVETAEEIERAIETFVRSSDGGLVFPPDTTTAVYRDLIIALAVRHQLPAVYTARFFVAAGGLMSYGADLTDIHRQAAHYVDRILRGTRPADLPVQFPTKFETALNLKTARALGLEVPPVLLVAADEVFE